MHLLRILLTLVLWVTVANASRAQMSFSALQKTLEAYKANLRLLRSERPFQRNLPDVSFYLFGMGPRRKMIYKDGALVDALTGDTLYRWNVKQVLVVPPAYTVYLQTTAGKDVYLFENEKGVYLKEGGRTKALTESPVRLPRFEGRRYAPLLRVLHHEVVMNIVDGKPVPNFFVYKKPWYRDAALMAMVLKRTGNLHLIKEWVLSIRDPFDRNNHGVSEADNPGEVLFLLSLFGDRSPAVVKTVLDSAKQFIQPHANGAFIEGPTDYSRHPVFQTKWMKYGLKSLGLADTFRIPKVYDSYSSLFWWDYRNEHVAGPRFDTAGSANYPYLVWAEDHFFGERKGMVSSGLYPLTWESRASDAHYPGMRRIDEKLVDMKLSTPHTWHASEMFLLLMDE